MKTIYDLQYDDSQQDGEYLLIFKEEGLKNEDLTAIQVNMLQNNFIPRLLPIEIEEIDLNVRLRYHVAEKKRLSTLLKQRKIAFKDYLQLLIQLVSVIEDSKIYMLNENHYILIPDFIFIGRNPYDIYLTYLPIKDIEKQRSLQSELSKFILETIRSTEAIQGQAYQRILEVIKQEHFNINLLRQSLQELVHPQEQTEVYPSLDHSSTIETLEKEEKKMNEQKNEKITQEKLEKDNVKVKEALKPLSERKRVLLFSVTFLLIAVLWRFYLDYQNEGFFYVSLGLTILLVDIDFILIKIWRPKVKRNTGKKYSTNKELRKSKEQRKTKDAAQVSNHEKRDASTTYYHNLSKNTSIITQSDETELLDQETGQDTDSNSLPLALLVRNRGVKTEKIEIKGKSFFIGRNSAVVHYVEHSRGVSRVHLEILYNQTGFGLKDLGSKNGSFLNNERLIPNKVYPLKTGDVIRVAKVEFTFQEINR